MKDTKRIKIYNLNPVGFVTSLWVPFVVLVESAGDISRN